MNNADTKVVNAIRVLSADAIQKAKSGHPGMPLGAAPIAYELWARHLRHDPHEPNWPDRDRFVLSAGHASMLLYSLLHLFGYGLTMADLRDFRQLDSATPGHPEYGCAAGVEATTGPLGAGVAMAVGMAMAEAHLAAVFNRPRFTLVDHCTYALVGDGCLMEGISSEALSLAGTFGLGKLIVLYDSNRVTIEGSTDLTFTEDVAARMAAFGFQTLDVADGNDMAALGKALDAAKADTSRPSFITVHTEIGYGCPAKQGKASSHGEPLGLDNVAALRDTLGWTLPPFEIPDDVYARCRELADKAAAARAEWQTRFDEYAETYPELAKLWRRYHEPIDGALIGDDYWQCEPKAQATRAWSSVMLNRLKDVVPQLMGGSADLGPSNKTVMADAGDFNRDNRLGRNIHFGVREIAMTGIANGLALHGGVRPYVATFFVFSDYAKPMMRLASLMRLPVVYVYTHDSIGVGEDGPTHEPVEQLAMLRAMPNLRVFRPCDGVETAAGWFLAATSQATPTALILSRQNLPAIVGSDHEAAKRGGYVLSEGDGEPSALLIASGSEVALAVDAQKSLAAEGVNVRVVSMPCQELFREQSADYRESVLPSRIRARVAIEAATDFGWGDFVGLDGATVSMHGFGASAPASVLFEKFGFTAANVVATVKALLAKGARA